jgi:hypothetical protein
MLQGVVGWFWRRLGYVSSTSNITSSTEVSNSAAAAAAAEQEAWKSVYFQLPTQLLQQQVFYVLALSQQLHTVQQRITAARDAQWQLLKASRQGTLDEPAAAAGAAGVSDMNAVFAGGSRIDESVPKQRLTLRDVVAAGSSSGGGEALLEAVAAGLGQLLGSRV